LPAKRRSLKAVLFVLLALQLMVGLQLQAALAVTSPMPMAMHAVVHHSPATSAAVGVAAVDHVHQTSHPDCPEHSTPHDCCHASACQCQCVYTPGAIALPALANIATSIAVPSLATTQFVAPRIDEFLRPPIA
jgi:hypothetical protein